jgi:hypothetical protein
MYVKIHRAYRTVVAVCDNDLIGNTFSEGIKEIKIHEHFFKGESLSKEQVIDVLKEMLKEDATFNFVGKESVECGILAHAVSKEGVMHIQKIPVALGLM